MSFAHLHVHTEYSLLDGSNKITEYVERVKELGMTAAAITDHGAMYGVIEFYKAAKKAGIKPILGCEVYVAPESRFEKEAGMREDRYHHLVLLAENNEGYANLIKIVSAGFIEGFYYRPRVDKELLRQYHSGIIASSACLAGEIASSIQRGDYAGAKAAALEYNEIFGEGNFFLELQDHGIREQKLVNQQLLRMHEETGIPLICTNDIHYTYKEDIEAHDILLCIQTAKKVTDEDRMRYEGGQYFVKSEKEMAELFSYVPEAIENTGKIADRCNVEITFGERKLPKYDVPNDGDAYDYLKELCQKGLTERYETVTEELQERLAYELETIHRMGFVDYFLIVWDYIRFARSQGIIVGPGRGSAAGSLVSYVLSITQLDPLRYGLLFERFLNPERISMPDIDVDFDYERRQEVIDYVARKYGQDRVAQIITFGTMAARGVIRDVARALDLPYAEADRIAKMVPRELNITLERALSMNPELRALYETDEQIRYLIDMALRLEGLPRNTSTHAAGVVISKEAVDEYVPLSLSPEGSVTTQFPMGTLEELGLLKMDFLGLRTLTVIENAVQLVNRENPEHHLDMDRIDYNDPVVMGMIGKGRTEGVFQLESAGMRSFMKDLRPQTLEDIIAGISLYRPGPMDFIPKYIEGKNHPEKVTYDCPQVEPILAPTYGCMVYQEQVMRIVRDLGGYSLGRSDLVRRAMSKKKADVMEKERRNFVYGNPEEGVPGCVKNGIDPDVANRIFDEMTDFANYAFNKSHAAAYAVVSFQTAYLKCYHTVEFMAALMTSVIDNPDKCAEYILHSRNSGIPILAPSVNEGYGPFTTHDGSIRYGLYAIKAIGRGVIDQLVAEREANGPFLSLKDFLTRTIETDLNKRGIENLIKAGALDDLPGTRKQKMQVYPLVLSDVERERKESISGQMNLFDLMEPSKKQEYEVSFPEVGEYQKESLLAFEKEVLGVYLSGHPLEEYEELWRTHTTATAADFAINDDSGESLLKNDERVTIGGMITGKTMKYTRNNKVMAFLDVEDLLGVTEVLVFPNTYERYATMLKEEEKVFIEGHVSSEDDKASKLILDHLVTFRDAESLRQDPVFGRPPAGRQAERRAEERQVPQEIRKEETSLQELWLAFDSQDAYYEMQNEVRERLELSPGTSPVVIYVREPKSVLRLPDTTGVTITDPLLYSFRQLFGEESVRVVEKRRR